MKYGTSMTSRDFVYWLQGFFEISGHGHGPRDEMSLTVDQVVMIRNHLNLVFKHEIDPSIDGGDPQKRLELQATHDGLTMDQLQKKIAEAIEKHEKKPHGKTTVIRQDKDPLIRC